MLLPPRTGLGWMDEEHAQLFHMFLAVQEAVALKQWRAAKKAHKTLVQTLREHFEREEALMDETRYPDAAAHTAAHQSLLQALASLYSGLSGASPYDQIANEVGKLKRAARAMIEQDHRLVEHLRRVAHHSTGPAGEPALDLAEGGG